MARVLKSMLIVVASVVLALLAMLLFTTAIASAEGPGSGEVVYVVQAGDTLSGIAKRFYDDPNLWPQIFEANRETIADPNLILVGQTLSIPGNPSASLNPAGLIENGGFEEWHPWGIPVGWEAFNNDGPYTKHVVYDETWSRAVKGGEHSCGIEISTICWPDALRGRFGGIFQVVEGLVPGTRYQLTIHGMIRSTEGSPKPWPEGSGYDSYSAWWGVDYTGRTDPEADTVQWSTINFPEYPLTEPGSMVEYHTSSIVPTGTKLTLFVKLFKMWESGQREVILNVDEISLEPSTELLENGDFEGGFGDDGVGLGWTAFHNGGAADYSWHDDTWEAVVFEEEHSQLIEINTYCRGGSDPDRYAGIYQKVEGLTPGAEYKFSMHGKLRSTEGDPTLTSYGYRVQVGVDYAGGTDPWAAGVVWTDVGWDEQPRLTPGNMEEYSTSITATGDALTLFVRVWKKWPTASREVDLNLDAISLKGS